MYNVYAQLAENEKNNAIKNVWLCTSGCTIKSLKPKINI